MVSPQTGQFQSVEECVGAVAAADGVSCKFSAELWSKRKQTGKSVALRVGQQAEVTDAHEATRKQVKQEAAQELIGRQSQQPLLVSMSGVSPAERDVAFRESNQPAVGDGDA
jgi:hypothetical protein